VGILHWFTRNWVDTAEGIDPMLVPLLLPMRLGEAMEFVAEAIRALPRWRVESIDKATGTIVATRRTRVCRFVDDVTIRLESTTNGVLVHARSQSRVGVGDFGQNRRNLLELFSALK
jgi:uncharacterized protein (DUF1499 family)